PILSRGGEVGKFGRSLLRFPAENGGPRTLVLRERDFGERAARRQHADLTRWTDRDLRGEGKPAQDLLADRGSRGFSADDERARGAHVDDVEMREVRNELRRAEDVLSADIRSSEKDDVRHRGPSYTRARR